MDGEHWICAPEWISDKVRKGEVIDPRGFSVRGRSENNRAKTTKGIRDLIGFVSKESCKGRNGKRVSEKHNAPNNLAPVLDILLRTILGNSVAEDLEVEFIKLSIRLRTICITGSQDDLQHLRGVEYSPVADESNRSGGEDEQFSGQREELLDVIRCRPTGRNK